MFAAVMRLALPIAVIAGSTVAYANESEGGKSLIYVGTGNADKGDPHKSSDRPMSIGFLSLSGEGDKVWGLDFSGEGTKLESTGGRTTVTGATSINFLIGKNLSKGENSRFDASLLVGVRTTSSTCPTSYLGYQCYADQPPTTSRGFNYGVVATMTYQRLMLGVRATGESVQALVGFRF